MESSEISYSSPSRVQIPGYRILEVRGVGAMATVYLAEHEALGRQVALKVLHAGVAEDDDYRERFLREARAAARLNHESVVRAYEAGVHEGSYWLAMEYVEGEDLSERLDREGSLTEAEALRIAIAVAKALEVASSHGLVHRDVKPENILLGDDGVVKLADLGLAKIHGDGSGSVTAEGISVGTVAFFSPEQCRGRRDLDVRSDLFALGGTLYTMITGDLPFDRGDNPPVTMKRIIEEWPSELHDPTKFSPSVRVAIKSLMAKRRRDRPADARAAIEVLREARARLDESQVGALEAADESHDDRDGRPRQRRRRGPRVYSKAPVMPAGALLAAAGSLALVLVAWWILRAQRQPALAARTPTPAVQVSPDRPRPTPSTRASSPAVATQVERPSLAPSPTPPPEGALSYDWRSAEQLEDWTVSGEGSEARVAEGALHFKVRSRGRLELDRPLRAPLELACDVEVTSPGRAWLTLEHTRGEGWASAGGALYALQSGVPRGLTGTPRAVGKQQRVRLVLAGGEARGWLDGEESFRHPIVLDDRPLTLGLLAEGGATVAVGPLSIQAEAP